MVNLSPVLTLPNIDADLARVEGALHRSVQTGDPFLTEVASHLISAGGKRLRPALALCAGQLRGQAVGDDVIMGACSVELVHLGSLYHDDVMDEARTRRNVESVNSRWGNLVAILSGDFLLARASEIAASLGTEVAGLLAATIGKLCEGQVRELQRTFDVGRTEEAYLTSISGKTGSLFSAACRIGAITAGLERPVVEAVTVYGQRFGMVFQIVDDILDVVSSEKDLGKPAGQDLVEGVYTLPVIRALAGAEADRLKALLATNPLGREQVDAARALIRSNGAVPAAMEVARGYAAEAAAALEGLDLDPGVVTALSSAASHLVDAIPA